MISTLIEYAKILAWIAIIIFLLIVIFELINVFIKNRRKDKFEREMQEMMIANVNKQVEKHIREAFKKMIK